MHEDDVAYICQTCGEAFAPADSEDWTTLKSIHNGEHGERARYTKSTVGKAF